MAASRAGTVAGALPKAFLRGLGPSSGAVADGPALTGPSLSTSASTSADVKRSVRERWANWSGKGCQVSGSTKTVVPVARETPCSGSAIKLPNLKPPLALRGRLGMDYGDKSLLRPATFGLIRTLRVPS